MPSEKVKAQVSRCRGFYKRFRDGGKSHSEILLDNPEIETEVFVILQQEYDGIASPTADQDISKRAVANAQQIGKPKQPKDMRPTLGNWLAWKRFKSDLTRPGLGEIMKMRVSRLSDIEEDVEIPTVNELLKFQKALDCKVPVPFLKKYPQFKDLIPA